MINIHEIFDRVDLFWNEANIKRMNLNLELLDYVYKSLQESFKKYSELNYININVNIDYDDDHDLRLDVSINGYVVNGDEIGPDELENEADIEQAIYYVILERLDHIEHEFIFNKNTTLKELQYAYGY